MHSLCSQCIRESYIRVSNNRLHSGKSKNKKSGYTESRQRKSESLKRDVWLLSSSTWLRYVARRRLIRRRAETAREKVLSVSDLSQLQAAERANCNRSCVPL